MREAVRLRGLRRTCAHYTGNTCVQGVRRSEAGISKTPADTYGQALRLRGFFSNSATLLFFIRCSYRQPAEKKVPAL